MVRVLTLAACLASLCSCDRTEAPPSSAPVAAPDLEVVSAGADPRTLLRYHPAAGTEQKLELAIAVQLQAGDLGGPMPTVVVQMTETVDAVMPSGQVFVHAHIDSARARDVDGSSVAPAAVQGPLAPLEGLSVAGVLAADGRMTATHLVRAATSALSPETEQQVASLLTSFESTALPLPDVPVGPGAVWRNSRELLQNTIKMTAVNTVTLTAVRGDILEYTLETDVHGPDQTVKQEDMDVAIKDIVGSGAGKGTVDLAKLTVTSELQAALHTEMTATGDTEPTKLDMTTHTRIQPL
jgi:hypothetical protein